MRTIDALRASNVPVGPNAKAYFSKSTLSIIRVEKFSPISIPLCSQYSLNFSPTSPYTMIPTFSSGLSKTLVLICYTKFSIMTMASSSTSSICHYPSINSAHIKLSPTGSIPRIILASPPLISTCIMECLRATLDRETVGW
jgi:hypothetical protein